MLSKYIADPSHVLQEQPISLTRDLSYEKEPVQILDRKEQVLRNKTISLVKVLWRSHQVEEATWESEEQMMQQSFGDDYVRRIIRWTGLGCEAQTHFLFSLFSTRFSLSLSPRFFLPPAAVRPAVLLPPSGHQLPPLHPSLDLHLLLSLPGLAPEPLTHRKRRKPARNAGKHFAGTPSSGHQSRQPWYGFVGLQPSSFALKGLTPVCFK
ncbi:hypothetical protein ACLB2K_029681 [Fragaria x ananassa]